MKNLQKLVVSGVFFSILLLGATHPAPALANSFNEFFSAIKRDDPARLRNLAARGFDLNTVNANGEPPLLLALKDEAWEAAAFLASHPTVNVEVRNAAGESPLMIAALKGQLALAERLIARQAEVNKPGWAPLHYAATQAGPGAVPMVRLLLEHHAYIDAESPNGTTPLMMAAHYGSPAVVKLLLEEGADPLLRNEQGLTAIDFAQRANREDSAALIAAFVRARQPAGRW